MGYILTKKTIAEVSSQLRKSGCKVIFTHGTFDLFHKGHSDFLNKCKKRGDILIVGAESDKNVKKYKDAWRPIYPEHHRADILANHSATDFVFINDEYPDDQKKNDTYYINLYKKLNPSEITFGRNFSYKKGMQKRAQMLKTTKYTQVNAIVKDEINSTTSVIEKIKRIHLEELNKNDKK